jgi:hypothetical protein
MPTPLMPPHCKPLTKLLFGSKLPNKLPPLKLLV